MEWKKLQNDGFWFLSIRQILRFSMPKAGLKEMNDCPVIQG